LPLGVFPSSGGGMVKPIGNTFLPLIESTCSGVINTFDGAVFGCALATTGSSKQHKTTSADRTKEIIKAATRDVVYLCWNGLRCTWRAMLALHKSTCHLLWLKPRVHHADNP
jgi:hypothetical protein